MTKVSKELEAALGVGMDDLESEAMPIIKILQPSGAEVSTTHQDYATKHVEGAEAGDLYFLAESVLLGKEVDVIPLAQTTLYVEWRPKSAGGGIQGHHPRSIIAHEDYTQGEGDNKYKEYLGNNELKLTIYFFVLAYIEEKWIRAIIPFASSNLKHGRAMMRQIKSFRYEDATKMPSIFSRVFKIKTQLVRGHGNAWFEFDVSPDRETPEELMLEAKEERTAALEDLPQPDPVPQLTTAEPVEAIETDAF